MSDTPTGGPASSPPPDPTTGPAPIPPPTPDQPEDHRDGQRAWLIVLGVLIVLLLAGILAVLLLRGGDETATTGGTTTSSTTMSTTSEGAVVVPTTARPTSTAAPTTASTASAPSSSETVLEGIPCDPAHLLASTGGSIEGVPVTVVAYACAPPGPDRYAWARVQAADPTFDPLDLYLAETATDWQIFEYGTGVVCDDVMPAAVCDLLPGAPRA